MEKQYKTTRHKFSKRKDGKFVIPKPVKQRYKNPKRKLNKHEIQFIKIHGRELYDKLRASRSELRKSPQLFRMVLRAGELFGVEFYFSFIEGGSDG